MTARRFATYSLAITAAALPAYNLRFHAGPLPTTLLEVLVLVTVATYGWTLWSERRRPAARTPYDIPIALFLVAGVIGIVVAPDHVRALGIYRAYFIDAIAVFYIAVDLIRTRAQLHTVLAVAGVAASSFALGQIISFAIVFAHHAIQIDDPPAFLNTSSNQAAMYIEPLLAFAGGFALYPETSRQRWIALAITVLLLTAFVLTLSRAGYIAVAVLAVIAVLSLPRQVRLWAVGGLAVVLLAVVELPFFLPRLATFAHSFALRQSIYSQTLRMLAQRPVLGAGISGFPIRVAPFRPQGEEIELYPHNIWLTTWSELGLLGVVSFALIFLGLIWRGARGLLGARPEVHRALAWGATGALVLYLVHGMFDTPYWKNDLAVEFWLIAALQVIALRGVRDG
ncbi:MAG TPA: O-antigen ligase family protein [Candidatus Dormibacteraeota bacterium]|nr:O-antigen ligase family protein [Candidatus Dormibacteraeota bacterium]